MDNLLSNRDARRNLSMDLAFVLNHLVDSPRPISVQPILIDLELLQTLDVHRLRVINLGHVDHDMTLVTTVNRVCRV